MLKMYFVKDGLLVEFVDVVEDTDLKWKFSNMTAEQQSSKNMVNIYINNYFLIRFISVLVV